MLGGADIGTPLEQRGCQAGRNFGREFLFLEAAAAGHCLRIGSDQQADLILGLLDLLLQHGNGRSRGIHQLLRLPEIQQRRDATALPRLYETQRILARLERPF